MLNVWCLWCGQFLPQSFSRTYNFVQSLTSFKINSVEFSFMHWSLSLNLIMHFESDVVDESKQDWFLYSIVDCRCNVTHVLRWHFPWNRKWRLHLILLHYAQVYYFNTVTVYACLYFMHEWLNLRFTCTAVFTHEKCGTTARQSKDGFLTTCAMFKCWKEWMKTVTTLYCCTTLCVCGCVWVVVI